MNVSRRWLEEFLRRPLEARDVAARLAMLGAPVDAIEPLHAGLEEIRVAFVEEVRPHPNADRLRLCTVDAGTGAKLNVVCGAANVTAGRKYRSEERRVGKECRCRRWLEHGRENDHGYEWAAVAVVIDN